MTPDVKALIVDVEKTLDALPGCAVSSSVACLDERFSKALWHLAVFKKNLIILCGTLFHAVVVGGGSGGFVAVVAFSVYHSSLNVCRKKFRGS